MCCFWTALVFAGPRLAILVWWLIEPARIELIVGGSWVLAILGWIFLPWSTLMYLLLMPVNGLVGFDWVFMGLALLADIAMYGGGAYGNRERISTYYQ